MKMVTFGVLFSFLSNAKLLNRLIDNKPTFYVFVYICLLMCLCAFMYFIYSFFFVFIIFECLWDNTRILLTELPPSNKDSFVMIIIFIIINIISSPGLKRQVSIFRYCILSSYDYRFTEACNCIITFS